MESLKVNQAAEDYIDYRDKATSARDDEKQAKESLIDAMVEADVTKVTVGDYVITLATKRAVSVK